MVGGVDVGGETLPAGVSRGEDLIIRVAMSTKTKLFHKVKLCVRPLFYFGQP